MKNADRIQIYKRCMVEIKERVVDIDMHLSGWRSEGVSSPKVCEATAFQLRKIYELIGFASMSADLERYREIKPSFQKDWNFGEILYRVSSINSEFLPKPIRRVRSTDPGVQWHLEERPEAILTKEELVSRHGYLNKFLHAKIRSQVIWTIQMRAEGSIRGFGKSRRCFLSIATLLGQIRRASSWS